MRRDCLSKFEGRSCPGLHPFMAMQDEWDLQHSAVLMLMRQTWTSLWTSKEICSNGLSSWFHILKIHFIRRHLGLKGYTFGKKFDWQAPYTPSTPASSCQQQVQCLLLCTRSVKIFFSSQWRRSRSEWSVVTLQVWTAVLIETEAHLFHQIQMIRMTEKGVDGVH